MSTAIQKTNQSTALVAAEEAGISANQLQIIKSMYASGATDDELAVFIQTAHRLKLDIQTRQIHLVKRGYGDKQTMTIQVGIDGFRAIADRTGKYVPGREPKFEYSEKGEIISATAYVKKLINNEWHEIAATAFYEEYVQKTKDGNTYRPNAMWAKMPRMMLAKTAEALALRKAFPAELGGVYSPDEMAQADNPPHIPNAAAGQTNWENPVEFSGPPQSSPQQPEAQGSKPLNPVATSLADIITSKQLGMIRAKVKAIPALDGYGLNADDECDAVFGCRTDELSKAAADYLIKHLIAVEAGKYAPAAKPKAGHQQPEVIEAEIVDIEVVKEAVERKLDEHAELIKEVNGLIAEITGGDEELVENLLKGRVLEKMPVANLRKFRDELKEPPADGVK
jgi:phage recombination protein Bet